MMRTGVVPMHILLSTCSSTFRLHSFDARCGSFHSEQRKNKQYNDIEKTGMSTAQTANAYERMQIGNLSATDKYKMEQNVRDSGYSKTLYNLREDCWWSRQQIFIFFFYFPFSISKYTE